MAQQSSKLPLPPPQLLSLVPRIELAKLADHIEGHDTGHRLFDFLYDQSLDQNRHSLDRYRGGDRRGVVFYAAATSSRRYSITSCCCRFIQPAKATAISVIVFIGTV